MTIGNYTLHDPWWLLALLAIPLVMWVRGRRGAPVLVVPFSAAWHRPSLIPASRWPAALATAGLVFLVLALARPQKVEDKREVKQQGYDLMLAIDLSGSMLSEDYERSGERINRIQAIKPVIQAFINQRTSDRIGLVIFSGRAYTLAPLTSDHDWLARQMERITVRMVQKLEDGTAIGDGLGIALTRLDQAGREEGNKRKGAFIILLTDGANNRGLLTPEQATNIAKSRAVPIYTIGAGRDGLVHFPIFNPDGSYMTDENGTKRYRYIPSDLDEEALIGMAERTGGKFYRAFDSDTIEKAFAAIDKAQKIEFQAKSYLLTTELFAWFAAPGAIVLFVGALLVLPPQLPDWRWRRFGRQGAPQPNGRPSGPALPVVNP